MSDGRGFDLVYNNHCRSDLNGTWIERSFSRYAFDRVFLNLTFACREVKHSPE